MRHTRVAAAPKPSCPSASRARRDIPLTPRGGGVTDRANGDIDRSGGLTVPQMRWWATAGASLPDASRLAAAAALRADAASSRARCASNPDTTARSSPAVLTPGGGADLTDGIEP